MLTTWLLGLMGYLLFPPQINTAQAMEESDNCVCTLLYAPVCGVDGITYGNACQLNCAWVTMDYEGECVEAPEEEEIIPATCTSWYDGCNICTVSDWQTMACTKRACFQEDQPYCQEHAFTYLSESDEYLIDLAVDTYLSNTPDNLPTAKQTIIDRVSEKEEEINTILMTSTFVEWSPELQTYEYSLEILTAIKTAIWAW